MLRFAVITLFVCSLIGAMMPSRTATPSTSEGSVKPVAVWSGGSGQGQADSDVDLGSGAITLQRESDGHFYADVQVNGAPVRFVVDTGASGIALSRDDAQRAGLLLDNEVEMIGSGASGPVYGQYVQLDRVNLGIKEVRDIPAVVLDGGEESLLGQSFLSQFDSVKIEDDRMVLR
jgi:aspartyl protease family protein